MQKGTNFFRNMFHDIAVNESPFKLCAKVDRMPADIEKLEAELDAAQKDAEALVLGLDETTANWTPSTGGWSVAQCLDHLAITNRVYLASLQEAADRARARGKLRRGAAVPGWAGRLFLSGVEPPVKPRTRFRAPANIQPAPAPRVAEAYASWAASQQQVRSFLAANADLDLAGIRFVNPILRGIRFSVATGLHIITAHERRHLWQARELLRLRERSTVH